MGTNDWFLIAWIAVMGGCVGSFLNVVIYRWPAGKSVVSPGSACPRCGHAIRGWHNLPVVGWLMLRGKCYDCGARISVRYPLVEAFLAVMFLALAIIYLFAGQSLLEQGPIDWPTRAARFLLFAWFIGTLLCSALIEFDRARLPLRLPATAIALGLILPQVLPVLVERPPTGMSMPGLIEVAQAALLALLLTALRLDRQAWRTTFADLLLVAVFLGPAGLAVVAIGASLADVVWNLRNRWSARDIRLPWSMWLLAAASAALLSFRIAPSEWLARLPVAVVLVIWVATPLVVLIAGWITVRRTDLQTDPRC